MKKTGAVLLCAAVLLCGCSSDNTGITNRDFLSETEASAELSPLCSMLSEKFYELSRNLEFDIAIPSEMMLYDTGTSDSIVRLCDKSGKNSIMLEARSKEDYEKLYTEYLHSVSATMLDYRNLRTYEEEILNSGNSARHFDIKLEISSGETDENGRDVTEQKNIRFWFINKLLSSSETEQDRAAYLIILEADEANTETMMKLISTFQEIR